MKAGVTRKGSVASAKGYNYGDKYIILSAEDSLLMLDRNESLPSVYLPSRVSEVSVGPLLGGHEVQRHQDRGGHWGSQ